jgi:2-dehydropantoate 2-reductase
MRPISAGSKRRSRPQLRFLVFGAGAVGTYIGGSLALASQRVVFVERPALAEGLVENGLRLRLNGQEHQVSDPEVVSGIDEALTYGPYDVAVLAIKSFDTQDLIDTLSPYKAALPPFLCLQNGVENEGLLAELLGPDRVIAGSVTTAVGRRGAGDIVLERLRGIGIAGNHTLSIPLQAVFNDANLNAQLYSRSDAMKWSKMLTNLMGNATSAILDMTPAQVFAHPGLYRLEVRQLRECLRVMRALKIPVVDLPGTPVRGLAAVVRLLPAFASQPLLYNGVGKGRGAKMPSFHIDLYAGRSKSEVDYLNGAVVRFGQQTGVQTPVNRLLTDTLNALASGGLPLENYRHRPDKLLGALKVLERG